MKTRIEFEVETLLVMLQAGVEAMDEIGRSPSGLTRYSQGWRDSRLEVIEHLKKIVEGMSE